jgi:hypothetical protein
MTGPLNLDGNHYVYELYAEDGTCLYVGCSINVGTRIQVHTSRAWWPQVARIEVNKYEGFEAGRQAEQERIQLLQPVHNRVFTNWPIPNTRRAAFLEAREERHAAGEMCNANSRCRSCNDRRRAHSRSEWWLVDAEDLVQSSENGAGFPAAP